MLETIFGNQSDAVQIVSILAGLGVAVGVPAIALIVKRMDDRAAKIASATITAMSVLTDTAVIAAKVLTETAAVAAKLLTETAAKAASELKTTAAAAAAAAAAEKLESSTAGRTQ